MSTQNSANASKGSKTESKNAVKNNAANSTRRVVETRDAWDMIFNHAVSLVVAYTRGQKVEDPRKGFAFGAIADQPHSRGYAQSLIKGFVTNKAGKVLKDFDDLAKTESREKIAIAILLDTKLAKDGTEGAKRIMSKTDPKREKVFAMAVLSELTRPEQKADTPKGGKAEDAGTKGTAPKGGKAKGENKPKAKPTTKGGSTKSETKKPTTKGGRKSATKQAAK